MAGRRTPRQLDPWPFVGLGLHACTAFLVGASVLFLPAWLVVLTGVIWALFALLGVLSFAAKPGRVLPFALVAVGAWILAVLGYAFLQ